MTPITRSSLVGAWRMVDMRTVKDGELHDAPLGPADKCDGLMIYTDSGLMSGTLSLRDRPVFGDPSLGGGTEQEKACAYDTFISYTGTFDFDEDSSIVTHHVQYASAPQLAGQDLPRVCVFDGRELTHIPPPVKLDWASLSTCVKWVRI